jgi:hypothetical protein
MNFETFTNLAIATEAPPIEVWERLNKDKELDAAFRKAMTELSQAAERLDLVKKAVFYGKPEKIALVKKAFKPSFLISLWNAASGSRPRQFVFGKSVRTSDDIELLRLAHCTIGIATESGELSDALMPAMDGVKPLDKIGVLEENHDVGWYFSIIFKVLNSNYELGFDGLIKKLNKRYGPKFDAYLAENRNLAEERKILDEFMK